MSTFSSYHIHFIQTLLREGVKFIVMGGQAAIYYGVRRGTGDLDLLVEPTRENGERLLAAFQKLSLEYDDLKADEFEKPLFLGLGFEPDAVDVFNTTPGVDFNESYLRANEIVLDAVSVKVVSVEDLIKNKESLKRPDEKGLIDEYDISILKRMSRKH